MSRSGLVVKGRGWLPRRSVFLASHCPARGRRVQSGPSGRRMRSAAPTPDAASARKDSAPASERTRAGFLSTPRRHDEQEPSQNLGPRPRARNHTGVRELYSAALISINEEN